MIYFCDGVYELLSLSIIVSGRELSISTGNGVTLKLNEFIDDVTSF